MSEEDEEMVQGDRFEEEDGIDSLLDNEYSEKENIQKETGGGEESGSQSSEERQSDEIKRKVVIVAVVIVVVVALVIIVLMLIPRKSRPADFVEEPTQTEEPFIYSSEERESLRLAGFTGDEIEGYQADGLSAKELTEAQKKKREKQYKTEIRPYFDSASKEFKQVWKDTWLGGGDLKFSNKVNKYEKYNITLNADYKKLPAKGYQLFIKFYLENGAACFTTVTPERYIELSDKGNILLSVDYTLTGDGKQVITDVTEIEQ